MLTGDTLLLVRLHNILPWYFAPRVFSRFYKHAGYFWIHKCRFDNDSCIPAEIPPRNNSRG